MKNNKIIADVIGGQTVQLMVYVRPELLNLIRDEINRLEAESQLKYQTSIYFSRIDESLSRQESLQSIELFQLAEYYKACLKKFSDKAATGETL